MVALRAYSNLMLRDGMLSPHSKILPQSVRATGPYDRHLSVSSLGECLHTCDRAIRVPELTGPACALCSVSWVCHDEEWDIQGRT